MQPWFILNPELKVNRSIDFSCRQIFCFVYFEIVQTQNRRLNNIEKISQQNYKTQMKILVFILV